METIKGQILKVVYSSPDSDYKVLSVRKGKKPFMVTGDFGPDLIPEIYVDFHGDYKTHAKYGTQFHSYSYEVTYKNDDISSIHLFLMHMAKWIGRERAGSIVETFGSKTIQILDENPERLADVPGIGKESIKSISESWGESRKDWEANKEMYSVKAFLISLGLSEKRSKRIIKQFGGMEAEKNIRENPYILSEVEGFGFTTADYIAKKLLFSMGDVQRLKSFILFLLNKYCSFEGHLYYETLDVVDGVNKYTRETKDNFLNKDIIGVKDLIPLFKELVQEKKIIIDKNALYSKKNYHYEKESALKLANIISKPSDLIFLTEKSIEDHIRTFEEINKIKLSEEQEKVLHFFSNKKVFVVTGGPGTGKTAVTRAIMQIVEGLDLNLAALTPTGISAKKLEKTIEHKAYTIHRALGFKGSEWTHSKDNPYKTDIVIVDESSMVDQEVLYRLLDALEDRTHIIFVGDHDQLPSVGPGNVLKELIECESIPVIKLTQIFRQEETSDIIKVAHNIKKGNTNLEFFKDDPKSDVFFLRKKDPQEIEKIVISLARKFKEEKRAFQILSPRNDGPLGVNPLNNILQEVLNPKKNEDEKEIKVGTFVIRKGDRVIIKKNDYQKEVFNGDVGKVLNIGERFLMVEIDGFPIEISLDEVDNLLKLAYILTVHKAQGMEYPYIILPYITQFGNMMLQRNLLYTAITRAKKKVIILGHGIAVEKSINNIKVDKRNTCLGRRIKDYLKLREAPADRLEAFQND